MEGRIKVVCYKELSFVNINLIIFDWEWVSVMSKKEKDAEYGPRIRLKG